MSLGPLYVFHGEVSVQVFCPFFNWVVCLPGVHSCEFFIYFGDQTLSKVSLGNMFSHRVCSLFILILFSLAIQKFFNSMRSHLFILSFMSLALGDISMKTLGPKCFPFVSFSKDLTRHIVEVQVRRCGTGYGDCGHSSSAIGCSIWV